MTQGQGPHDDGGGYVPYEPGTTPEPESTLSPFVPYGAAQQPPDAPVVPYGGANLGDSSFTRFADLSSGPRRAMGWVVGLVVTLVACGGSVFGVAFELFDLFDDDDQSSTTTYPGFTPSVAVPSITIPSITIPSFTIPSITIPKYVLANDLEAGQCLIGLGFEAGSNTGLANLEVKPCRGAHNAQVLEVRVLTKREAADYSFADPQQGNKSCFPLFSPAQRALFQDDKYTLLSFTQSISPNAGDKVACLIARTDGKPYRGFLPRR